jgi:hypothetical protein
MSKPSNPFADLEALRQGAEVVEFPATETARRAKRGRRLVAFPWTYMVDVCRLTTGRTALIVAQLIYRRTHVCKSLTVTLSKAELADCGVNRSMKQRALKQLAAAGLIQIEPPIAGRTARVTLLWEET